jgi:hypothetical protein
LVELGFQSFHDAGINDILGGNGKNKGLEGLGFGFETESLVNGRKPRASAVMSRSMRAVPGF